MIPTQSSTMREAMAHIMKLGTSSNYKTDYNRLNAIHDYAAECFKAEKAEGGWMPIDANTPKHDKMLLGVFYEGKFYQQMASLWNKNGKSTVTVGFRKSVWPTHWQPLPQPPQQVMKESNT